MATGLRAAAFRREAMSVREEKPVKRALPSFFMVAKNSVTAGEHSFLGSLEIMCEKYVYVRQSLDFQTCLDSISILLFVL